LPMLARFPPASRRLAANPTAATPATPAVAASKNRLRLATDPRRQARDALAKYVALKLVKAGGVPRHARPRDRLTVKRRRVHGPQHVIGNHPGVVLPGQKCRVDRVLDLVVEPRQRQAPDGPTSTGAPRRRHAVTGRRGLASTLGPHACGAHRGEAKASDQSKRRHASPAIRQASQAVKRPSRPQFSQQ